MNANWEDRFTRAGSEPYGKPFLSGPAGELNYMALADQARMGLCVVDLCTKRFGLVNDTLSRWTGYNRDELLGMNPMDLLDEPGRRQAREQMARWRRGESPDTGVDYRMIGRGGRETETLVNLAVTGDGIGNPTAVMVFAQNITERKHTEEMLRASAASARAEVAEMEKRNRLITDFYIDISHDLKTPLSILLLGIDLMDRKTRSQAGGADIRRQIPVLRQNAYRLNRLVTNLLDITKLNAGFLEPAWERKETVGWLRRLVMSTEIYAKQRGIAVTFSSSAEEKIMLTDGFMLDRIMLNLLSNAYKHTMPGGQVSVTCRVEPKRIEVRVKDTGEGIPAEKHALVFHRFQQADPKLTRTGSGIGLALTKSLVELLGGKIWFQSAAGEGSEFCFELPVIKRESVSRPAVEEGMNLECRVQLELSDIGIETV